MAKEPETYFPSIKTASHRLGTELVDGSDSWGVAIVIALFGLIFGGLPLGIIIMSDGLNIFSILFVSVFVFFGLLMVGVACVQIKELLQFGKAHLVVPTWPLKRGQRCKFYYSRPVKKRGFSVDKLECKLEVQEAATYQVGTDTRTDYETIWSIKTTELPLSSGRRGELELEWEFDLPDRLPPSFHARRNKINWNVTVDVFADKKKIADSSFMLLVLA